MNSRVPPRMKQKFQRKNKIVYGVFTEAKARHKFTVENKTETEHKLTTTQERN